VRKACNYSFLCQRHPNLDRFYLNLNGDRGHPFPHSPLLLFELGHTLDGGGWLKDAIAIQTRVT